ncbi:MAG TPA: hypothetical protein VGJ16_06160 [Pirellulales bacterium]|jgi:hypothetical protein
MERKGLQLCQVLFDVGEIVITPAAIAALESSGQTLSEVLARHSSGDWGEVSAAVRLVNERGLTEYFNLQSCYSICEGQHLVVVTNGERTLTTIHYQPASTCA